MVVEDEPLARNVVRGYIEKIPSLDLAGECGDAVEAAAFLHANTVDLIFLDIKMPGMTGFEFLDTLESPPAVIVTTAYAEHALEGFEHSAVDYLLKPIPFERFLKSVNKAARALGHAGLPAPELPPLPEADETSPRDEFLFLKSGKSDHRVRLTDIRCVEGWRNSVKVHTGDDLITVPGTLSAMAGSLPGDRFIRVHKSFIVAVGAIDRIEGDRIHLGDLAVPVGKYYKKDLQAMVAAHRPKRGPDNPE